MADMHDLQRFVTAQEPIFEQVRTELSQSRKVSHWMWFIFPQIAGLGRSATARKFALPSRAAAEAYLNHPVLGPRLRECARLTNAVQGRSAYEIFGTPDDLKLHSSMTLFAAVAKDAAVFNDVLQHYFNGNPDAATLAKL
jgi:uncharacterized protein (DUF1810 family)